MPLTPAGKGSPDYILDACSLLNKNALMLAYTIMKPLATMGLH